jgi:hypothetical protein
MKTPFLFSHVRQIEALPILAICFTYSLGCTWQQKVQCLPVFAKWRVVGGVQRWSHIRLQHFALNSKNLKKYNFKFSTKDQLCSSLFKPLFVSHVLTRISTCRCFSYSTSNVFDSLLYSISTVFYCVNELCFVRVEKKLPWELAGST